MANIVFRIPQKLYILTDFKQEILDKISEKMWKINRELGSNECNFYDFEEHIKLNSLKDETKNQIKQIHYGLEFVHIEIDEDVHKTNSKRKMHIETLQTFKGLNLHTIMVSKIYEIESIEESVVKLKGIEKEINLKNIKYEYKIE